MDLTWGEGAALALQVAMGISLAACAGLRAFLPLLVVGIAGRIDVIPLAESFAWIGSWPAITVFAVAVVAELAADKFPLVDHLLDAVELFVKPVAGIVLVATVVTELSPLETLVLGIVLGGPSAGVVHLLKAKLRLLSTISTGGLGNPVVSTSEDVGALVGSLLALAVPLFALLLLIVCAVVAAVGIRWLVRRGGAGRGIPAATP
jgi:hypothetical protein